MLRTSDSQRARRLRSHLRADVSDAALVLHAREGDEDAFTEIFRRHQSPLLSYCRHMLGDRDEGEDALQQVFIKAHRALRSGTEPLALRPWLYGIARNCCLSAIAARRSSEPLGDGTQAFAGMSDAVIQREDLRELVEAVGRLPEDQRSALLLAELGDLNHEAIATVVGCSVSKVKALIYQARSALIAEREARNTPCEEIREQLAVARGGELRRGPLRRHLRLCESCRQFQLAVSAQRQSLALILPIAPSVGLFASVLGHVGTHAAAGAGLGHTGAAGVASGAAVSATGGVASGSAATSGGASVAAAAATGAGTAASATGVGAGTAVATSVATKLAIVGAVVAIGAAGAIAVRHADHSPRRSDVATAVVADAHSPSHRRRSPNPTPALAASHGPPLPRCHGPPLPRRHGPPAAALAARSLRRGEQRRPGHWHHGWSRAPDAADEHRGAERVEAIEASTAVPEARPTPACCSTRRTRGCAAMLGRVDPAQLRTSG